MAKKYVVMFKCGATVEFYSKNIDIVLDRLWQNAFSILQVNPLLLVRADEVLSIEETGEED